MFVSRTFLAVEMTHQGDVDESSLHDAFAEFLGHVILKPRHKIQLDKPNNTVINFWIV